MRTGNSLPALGWRAFFEKQVTVDEWRSCQPARVTAVHKFAFSLFGESGSLSAVIAGKVLHNSESQPDLPVVGDWVLARPPVGGTTVIVRRLERRSELSRRQPSDRNSLKASATRQILASNLDYVFIMMSLNQDLNVARLERALTMVWNSGATPVVLLSKSDLCPVVQDRSKEIHKVAQGANVHAISSLNRNGLDEILDYFKPGITACLIGSSGAGKTTLINTLCGTHYSIRAVRQNDDKGRHATTARSLHILDRGGMLIDTPGLREIGLMDDSALNTTFCDIADLSLACKFKDCTHRVEPGCAVLVAVAEGKLSRERYNNYLKLNRELEYQESKSSTAKHQESKKKQKQLGKLIKSYFKNQPQ